MTCSLIRPFDQRPEVVPRAQCFPLLLRRYAGVGDVVAATIITDRLAELGYETYFHSHHNCEAVIKRAKGVHYVANCNGKQPQVNLDLCYEHDPYRKQKHLFTMLWDSASRQLSKQGIDIGSAANRKPQLSVHPMERQAAASVLSQHPKPWVMICPRSNSYRNRQIPDGAWMEIAKGINGTCFWLDHLHGPPSGIVNLNCTTIDDVIAWLSAADLMLTVDTGPMHIAGALNVPVIAIGQSNSPELRLSPQSDFITLGNGLDCLNCQLNVCPISEFEPPCQTIDAKMVVDWVDYRLGSIQLGRVTAVVPIYRPSKERLNRCLSALLPQVSDIVVTMEQGSIRPSGSMTHDRIYYVTMPRTGVGYGPNANFGARYASGKYLWFVNDDCYPKPYCLLNMQEAMSSDTALVGHYLAFEDGRTQHAGMARSGNGYYHVDYRKRLPNVVADKVREVEMVTGASILVRRKAFFDCGGFPEDHYMYHEDTHLCLNLRKAGWKVKYTPFAHGIHDEHSSSKELGNVHSMVQESHKIFWQRWHQYFTHNKNNPGLGDFNY